MSRAPRIVFGLAVLASALPATIAVARRTRAAEHPIPAWQAVITSRDRDRLREWRQAWLDGLGQARAAGKGAAIDAEGALLLPDAALNDPAAPDGSYRCRTIKLGAQAQGGSAFGASSPLDCRIAGGRFTKLGGTQRQSGLLWTFDGVRLLFLGTMALGDEREGLPYGRDRERDLAGVLERIGANRWRLVLPRPQWESQIDVIELVPAS